MASVWVWRASPDGFVRPYRLTGYRALPHLVAHGFLHVIRKLENALLPYAKHRADRPHIIEHEAIRAGEPNIIGKGHHVGEVADGDNGAQREPSRHGSAGASLRFGVSRGLYHARGMDREWPTE